MIIYVILGIIALLIPFVRFFITHIHLTIPYSIYDIYLYFKLKKWREFNCYGIDMYVGMFGHGKTLSMTHRASELYSKFGDELRFISNYKLNGIPYIPLINFNQLVDIGEEDDVNYKGTVVLIDEIENVLNNRNFASFPLALLHMLTQQRKKKVYILCSAQRFFMVDKLFRSITTNVIDCNKYWRFQKMSFYDAWDYENAMNPKMVQSLRCKWWFVRNRDYDCYDTSEMVKKSTATDFISNEESLVRRGFEALNADAVLRPSKYARGLKGPKK